MAQQDLIAVSISDDDLNEIQGAITTLQSKLVPYLTTLTPQERQELPKMGDKTVAFVQKALEYGQKNGELVPSFLDLNALKVDTAAVQSLRGLAQQLNPIAEALNDSMTLSGSEAYQAALVFYSSVKTAAKVKAPNAGVIYEDLASRFPGGTTKKKA